MPPRQATRTSRSATIHTSSTTSYKSAKARVGWISVSKLGSRRGPTTDSLPMYLSSTLSRQTGTSIHLKVTHPYPLLLLLRLGSLLLLLPLRFVVTVVSFRDQTFPVYQGSCVSCRVHLVSGCWRERAREREGRLQVSCSVLWLCLCVCLWGGRGKFSRREEEDIDETDRGRAKTERRRLGSFSLYVCVLDGEQRGLYAHTGVHPACVCVGIFL